MDSCHTSRLLSEIADCVSATDIRRTRRICGYAAKRYVGFGPQSVIEAEGEV